MSFGANLGDDRRGFYNIRNKGNDVWQSVGLGTGLCRNRFTRPWHPQSNWPRAGYRLARA